MKIIVALISLFVVVPAFAGDGGGSDGCGLGWQVTQKKSMLATTTRGTTNAFVPPTFGMTTGTIGCDKHSFAKREMPAVNLVATNQDAIMMDIAAGGGENIASLAQALGCANGAAFAKEAQAHYVRLVDASAAGFYRNMKSLAVAQGCSI